MGPGVCSSLLHHVVKLLQIDLSISIFISLHEAFHEETVKLFVFCALFPLRLRKDGHSTQKFLLPTLHVGHVASCRRGHLVCDVFQCVRQPLLKADEATLLVIHFFKKLFASSLPLFTALVCLLVCGSQAQSSHILCCQ